MSLSLRCRLGLHEFPFPPHDLPDGWELWRDFDIECARGCGARRTRRCHRDDHWQEKHPERVHAALAASGETADHLAAKDRSAAEYSDTRSDCPACGEWRDSPTADCAACGFADAASGETEP